MKVWAVYTGLRLTTSIKHYWMPIRQDIQVIPADKPELLRLGWVVYEEIGIAVVNPFNIQMAHTVMCV